MQFFRKTVVVVVESAGNCAKILSDCLQILQRIYSLFRNEMKGLLSYYQILRPQKNGPNLPYFWNTKSHVLSVLFFSFHAFISLINSLGEK